MFAYQRKLLTTEPDDLIGYWSLDEATGDTAADASGNQHDGTAEALTWGDNGIGDGTTCAEFDGAGSYVDVYSTGLGDLLDGDEGTLLLWVRSSNGFLSGSGSPRVFARFAASANDQVLIYSDDTGQVVGQRTANGASFWPSSAALLSDTGWHCLALTWSKSADELKLYVNGALADSDTGLAAWNGSGLSSTDTLLGAYSISSGVSLPWDGKLAHVALWKKALTPTQVSTLAKLYIMPKPVLSAAAVPQPLLRGSGPTTWTIAVDWDRNGTFDGTYDDVTDRVISAQWFLGFRQPYQDAADNSALALTLKNHDRQYSPEYSGSPLFGKVVPFRPARIQSSDGLVTRTHWQGWVESFQPAVNRYGQRVVQIVATGPMQFLKAAETAIELQEDKRTDQIIAELIQEVVFPPALASAWVVGRVGHSEVGVTTFVADVGVFSDLDEGALTLVMAGDNWVRQGGLADTKQNTFNVYHAIRDVAAGERGRFLFGRGGKALFWNRHHLLRSGVALALFDETMNDMAYVYAGLEHMKNEVIVTCHPRDISDSDQDVLWELPAGSVINVSPDEPRTLFVKYEDENGKRVGAKDVTVGDLEFEKGTAAAAVEAKATGAELTFTNAGTEPAVITQCIVRGRKIVDSGSMDAKATDAASIVDYGRRTLQLNLPVIDNLEAALHIARREKHRRGQPAGSVSTIKMISHGRLGGRQHQRQLALTVGDKIAIAEGQTGHDAEHYIIGESHKLSAGATLFESTWYLEAAPATDPWTLGVEGLSELGDTTMLVY